MAEMPEMPTFKLTPEERAQIDRLIKRLDKGETPTEEDKALLIRISRESEPAWVKGSQKWKESQE